VPTLLALVLGAALHAIDEPGLNRAGQLAWFVSVGLFAGLVAIILSEYTPAGIGIEDDPDGLLTVTMATTLLALVLWVLSPSHPQVLALGTTVFALGQAVGNWPDEFNEVLAGMMILGFGVAGLALTEAQMLRPRFSGRLVFAVLCAVGPYEAGSRQRHGLRTPGLRNRRRPHRHGVVRASFTLLAVAW